MLLVYLAQNGPMCKVDDYKKFVQANSVGLTSFFK